VHPALIGALVKSY